MQDASESKIQRSIVEVAVLFGYKPYRLNAGNRRNYHGAEEGTPDLLVVMDRGRSLWVEVKRPGERPTEIQAQRHRELRSLGHAVVVATSVDEFRKSVEELCSLH